MKRIGVVGAGIMGAGIAQAAAHAGLTVRLYDIGSEPLAAGLGRVHSGLDRLVQRGKLSQQDGDAALARIQTTSRLSDFHDVDFVIEAAPEVLALKKQIFAELDETCRADVVLATNTSSLSVTEIASMTRRQELVAGMHFFNPVPVMKLVEVVRGARTSPETAVRTTELARLLGKTPVQAKDTPGFIVNRIARPFPGEALRILGENVAGVRQIDRAAKLAAGFRMGPFELMDLVGMDINFAVNKSVFEQFFYDPRFRPHPLQAQMVKANLLGRKTGAGWYRYESEQIVDGPAGRQFHEEPGPKVAGIATVFVAGDEAMADLVAATGYTVVGNSDEADLIVIGAGQQPAWTTYPAEALVLVDASCETVTASASRINMPERVAGYGGIPSVAQRQLVEIAVGIRTETATWQRAALFFQSLGREIEVIHDGPALIAPRLIACLVNEAAYALMEGVATVEDIDTAMKLGLNYPYGPLEWADTIGLAVLLRILEGLQRETGEDRYRPCPHLRKLVLAERTFYELCHG